MYERKKYKSFYTVANSCIESGILGRNDRIIHQTVNSFANKDYDLASIGITVVLDGTLSRITGNVTTNIKSRVDQLLQQLNDDEELTNLFFLWYAVLSFMFILPIHTFSEVKLAQM